MQLEPGVLVGGGRFRLIRAIGSGGMASVWAARHEILGRDVALKLMRMDGDASVARFLREAQIIGKFDHANIVGVLDAGQLVDEGYVFLVMELLCGAPLADRLVPGVALAPSEIVPILVDVCRGLEVAHAAGVVHRDIKPENVFLAEGPDGPTTKIVDFGISRSHEASRAEPLTVDGQLLGTPAYMSPEQARGIADVDARADLWAVGVVLHEALSGAQPFAATSHYALLRRIVDDEPEPLPPDVPAELRAVVAKCLAKDPERRYASAAALREDLERALHDRAAARSMPEPTRPPSSRARRRRRAATTTELPGPRLLLARPRRRPRVVSRAFVVATVAAFSVAIAGFSAAPDDPAEPLDTGLASAARAGAARLDRTAPELACAPVVTPEPLARPAALDDRGARCDAPSPPRPIARGRVRAVPRRTHVTRPGF